MEVGAQGWQPYHLHVPTVWKSWESGPSRAFGNYLDYLDYLDLYTESYLLFFSETHNQL
jgi:hypothetical protein